MLINDDGWALTCKHVVAVLAQQQQISANYTGFKARVAAVPKRMNPKKWQRECEKHWKLLPNTTVQIMSRFINCVDIMTGYKVVVHPQLDIALVQFQGFTKIMCKTYPVFATNGKELAPGKGLCRLGFPFAQYTNFSYDSTADKLQWTTTGMAQSPLFPLDGMVTRMVANPMQEPIGIELSTPGLKGQSGGPAFDVNGVIWGMQSQTAHLDLDFDINKEVLRGGLPKQVKDTAFLHVGHCIHVNELKKFMRANNVLFQEQNAANSGTITAVA